MWNSFGPIEPVFNELFFQTTGPYDDTNEDLLLGKLLFVDVYLVPAKVKSVSLDSSPETPIACLDKYVL